MFMASQYFVMDASPKVAGLGYNTISIANKNPNNIIAERRYNNTIPGYAPEDKHMDSSKSYNDSVMPYSSDQYKTLDDNGQIVKPPQDDHKKDDKKGAMMMWIIVGVAAIVLIILILVVVKKFCNKKKEGGEQIDPMLRGSGINETEGSTPGDEDEKIEYTPDEKSI